MYINKEIPYKNTIKNKKKNGKTKRLARPPLSLGVAGMAWC